MPGRKGRAASNASRNRASSSGSWKTARRAPRLCDAERAERPERDLAVGHGRVLGRRSRTRARRPLPRERRLLPRAADARRARHPQPPRAPPPAFLRLGRRRSLLRAKEILCIKRTRGGTRAGTGAQRGAEHELLGCDAVAAVVHLRSARRFGARGRVALCAAPGLALVASEETEKPRSRGIPDRRPHRGRGRRLDRRAIARAARVSIVQLRCAVSIRPRRSPRRCVKPREHARRCRARVVVRQLGVFSPSRNSAHQQSRRFSTVINVGQTRRERVAFFDRELWSSISQPPNERRGRVS